MTFKGFRVDWDLRPAGRRRQPDDVVEPGRDGTRTIDGCVDDLCRERRLDDLAAFIARLSDPTAGEATAAVTQPNDFVVGIPCRSIDVSERTFAHLAAARHAGWAPEAVTPAESFVNHRFIDMAAAERALRFHKIRARMA